MKQSNCTMYVHCPELYMANSFVFQQREIQITDNLNVVFTFHSFVGLTEQTKNV